MHLFTINQSSLSFITQLLLLIVIIGYLLSLRRKSVTSWLLIGFWSGAAILLARQLLVDAFPWYWPWRWVIYPFDYLALYPLTIALLQFAYRFPAAAPERPREARGILWYSLLITGIGLSCQGGQMFRMFTGGPADYHTTEMAIESSVGVGFLWAIFVLLRRTVALSRAAAPAMPGGWFGHLIHPATPFARGACAFAGSLLLLPGVVLSSILATVELLSRTEYLVIFSFGILLFLFCTTLIYLNYASEPSSLLAKIIGITLVVVLALFGMVGWIVAPSMEDAYVQRLMPSRSELSALQTLRYDPTPNGGYRISAQPGQLDPDIGEDLRIADGEQRTLSIPFPFPFYGRVWQDVQIGDDGFAAFGSKVKIDSQWLGSRPTIVAFLAQFTPALGGGVFLKTTPTNLTITWHEMRQSPENIPTTIQLALHADGQFHIIAATVDPSLLARTYRGILPGKIGPAITFVDWSEASSLQTTNDQGLIEDYLLDFRQAVHQRLLPLLSLIVGTTLIIVIGFPWFFKPTLLAPLNALVAGLKDVNAGNFAIRLPVRYQDELGFVTSSFNSMTAQLQASMSQLQQTNQALDHQVEQRTTQLDTLQHLFTQIRQVAEHLGQSSEHMMTISAEMSSSVAQTSQQAHRAAANSHHISESVSNSAASTEQVAANIHEVARNIQEVADIVTSTVAVVNNASCTLTSLQAHSQEIDHISNVITAITQQTNLLALNATIEAARSGDAGRGFRVVANEVKELAHEIARSADDITRKIEAVQQSTQAATDAMSAVSRDIHRIEELATAVMLTITEQRQATDTIARTVSEAAYGSQEISRAIAEVDQAAIASLEQTEQVQSEARELATLAEQLWQLLKTYQQEGIEN